ncbi:MULTISPECIES: DUF4192 domain-containing protein [Thermomonosporaceae]|uniref:DUF4192 domain-containing protein n=1 Tax=Thermomonosporaceae TaxID=2012 RepID=UPI00255AEDCB|nr:MULTISPECIES: DUF4192 domain-containing protein [Thermomonosporaceae]MDL4775181.1 DUF4192 domain-containing protein [Actinomadura xylanilytica]
MHPTPGGGPTPLVIRTAPDAIAAVPYLLGFHPSRSLVVIGFSGPHQTCAIRLDLPSAELTGEAAERVAAMLAGNAFRGALLLGYGPADEVALAVGPMSAALEARGLAVPEAIRIADGRWWSLTCPDETCCPPGGTPYDSSGSAIAAQATFAGQVALADRAELVRSVEPVGGLVRTAMRAATGRAERRFLNWARDGLGHAQIQSRLSQEGLALLPGLLARTRDGPPSHDETAWLGVLLTSLRVRDEAWIRVDQDAPGADIAFWRDILRRVERPYAAAPACLLAFAAYSAGDGGLANIALDRACDADPRYSMAFLLREVIAAGIPPSQAQMRMTPEQLAAAYTDQGDGSPGEETHKAG